MYFFMELNGDFINTVGISNKQEENMITQEEYDELCSLLNKPPIAPVGKVYKLKLDKTWELIEV